MENLAGDKMSVRWIVAKNFSITSLYPNPFNGLHEVDYSVEQAGNLRLSVYNILGQEVAVYIMGFRLKVVIRLFGMQENLHQVFIT